ncbi:MAG: NAD(P)/FAD-dependent oxidoreductase [Candidatus Taylorbacteria bacterium]|nr:NAD(P)/FAD-dependent oxidoreductase [Candidatus Taylorbacteria bacterium]
MNKTHIVIVGGGFGGVYTAKNLYKLFNKNEVDITIINKSNYFLFTPLLHEVSTGGLTPDSIIESMREVFRGSCVNIVEDFVIDIDKGKRMVKTATTSFLYDYLVISTGSETNYFNTEGAKEHTFTLKSLEDAMALRNHILQTCEKAVQTKNKDLLVTAVVGAGPTGVELSAEILEYMQHTLCAYYRNSGFVEKDVKIKLMTMTPDLISQFPQKMRDITMIELNKKGVDTMTNTIVLKVEPNLLTFKDGSTLKAHTIIWVAGVTAGVNGRIEINQNLQTVANPEIFALGDAAGKFPMLAQVAVQQAKTVARNIYALAHNKELSVFEYKQKGLLLSIGQWYAVGHLGGMTFKGRIMWLIWRVAYLSNFLSWRKRFEIAFEWTENLFSPRDISYLK